jgi:carbon storage regulator
MGAVLGRLPRRRVAAGALGCATAVVTAPGGRVTMLVLSRKINERILIGDHIQITVVGLRGNQVRLGIEAPDDVAIFREELVRPQDRPTSASPQTREVTVDYPAIRRS